MQCRRADIWVCVSAVMDWPCIQCVSRLRPEALGHDPTEDGQMEQVAFRFKLPSSQIKTSLNGSSTTTRETEIQKYLHTQTHQLHLMPNTLPWMYSRQLQSREDNVNFLLWTSMQAKADTVIMLMEKWMHLKYVWLTNNQYQAFWWTCTTLYITSDGETCSLYSEFVHPSKSACVCTHTQTHTHSSEETRTRDHWVTNPTLWPLGHDCPALMWLL